MAGITSPRPTARWTGTTLPDFKGKKALILGGAFFGSVVALFAEAGFERATTVDEADVVVFCGGNDINPELYGADPHPTTQRPNKDRDFYEKAVYEEALEQGKVMYGICRGFQFLAAMNGASLWQDVDGHAGPDHDIYDCESDCLVSVTSYHHQMVALDANMEVLAVCKDQISRRFESDTFKLQIAEGDVEIEIEAAYWKKTKCLGVQGHPEVGSKEYRSWSMHSLHDALEGDLFDSERPSDEVVGEDIETQMELWRQAALM